MLRMGTVRISCMHVQMQVRISTRQYIIKFRIHYNIFKHLLADYLTVIGNEMCV